MTSVGTPGYKELRFLFNMNWDGADKWGDVMSFWFATAEVIYHCTDADVPAEWEFRDSPVHDDQTWADEADWPESEIIDLFRTGRVNVDDLLTFGDVLTSYAHILDMAGESY